MASKLAELGKHLVLSEMTAGIDRSSRDPYRGILDHDYHYRDYLLPIEPEVNKFKTDRRASKLLVIDGNLWALEDETWWDFSWLACLTMDIPDLRHVQQELNKSVAKYKIERNYLQGVTHIKQFIEKVKTFDDVKRAETRTIFSATESMCRFAFAGGGRIKRISRNRRQGPTSEDEFNRRIVKAATSLLLEGKSEMSWVLNPGPPPDIPDRWVIRYDK